VAAARAPGPPPGPGPAAPPSQALVPVKPDPDVDSELADAFDEGFDDEDEVMDDAALLDWAAGEGEGAAAAADDVLDADPSDPQSQLGVRFLAVAPNGERVLAHSELQMYSAERFMEEMRVRRGYRYGTGAAGEAGSDGEFFKYGRIFGTYFGSIAI
jgi:hypothetical protein